MKVLREYFIPNELFLTYAEMFALSARWDDVSELTYGQNLLVRSYPSVIIPRDDEEIETA